MSLRWNAVGKVAKEKRTEICSIFHPVIYVSAQSFGDNGEIYWWMGILSNSVVLVLSTLSLHSRNVTKGFLLAPLEYSRNVATIPGIDDT